MQRLVTIIKKRTKMDQFFPITPNTFLSIKYCELIKKNMPRASEPPYTNGRDNFSASRAAEEYPCQPFGKSQVS